MIGLVHKNRDKKEKNHTKLTYLQCFFVIDHGNLISSSCGYEYEPKICFDMSKYSPSNLRGPLALTLMTSVWQ